MKYSEKDMAALIGEVEAQFAEHLAKAEKEQTNDLNKSEKIEDQTVAEATANVSEESVEKNEEFDYDEEDIAEMNKLYGSMSKAEAEAHYNSIKKTLFGEETSEVVETPAEIQKTEAQANEQEKSSNDLMKSELETVKAENEGLKKTNDELKKNLESLVSVLSKSVKQGSAPKQKAITKIEYIAKSELEKKPEENQEVDISKLSKSQISDRLTQKIRSGSLKKSDRDCINEYYLSGNKNIDSIRHLL